MLNTNASPAMIRLSAMNLLAIREHSTKELEYKLLQKFDSQESIKNVIKKLTNEGLQSDERFTEAFIIMRQHQGKGPVLIGLELKERGVNSDVIARFLNVTDNIWYEVARKSYIKKFGGNQTIDLKLKAKQIRFLTTRGFTLDIVKNVLKNTDFLME